MLTKRRFKEVTVPQTHLFRHDNTAVPLLRQKGDEETLHVRDDYWTYLLSLNNLLHWHWIWMAYPIKYLPNQVAYSINSNVSQKMPNSILLQRAIVTPSVFTILNEKCLREWFKNFPMKGDSLSRIFNDFKNTPCGPEKENEKRFFFFFSLSFKRLKARAAQWFIDTQRH